MMLKYKGFTIIELMISIAILGILVAIAAPSFTESIARRRLDGIANELSTDLQYARAEAVSKNRNIVVTFNTAGTVYTVDTLKTVTVDSRCSISATTDPSTTPPSITFEPARGIPTLGTSASITVACSPQTAAQLRVDISKSSIGVVTLCSPGGSFGGYPSC